MDDEIDTRSYDEYLRDEREKYLEDWSARYKEQRDEEIDNAYSEHERSTRE